MKTRWIVVLGICALLAGCAVFSVFNRAPQPGPVHAGPQEPSLTVICDPDCKVPRLSIPRSLLVGDEQPKRAHAGTFVPTVVTGIALSAALVIGGLWFAGRGNRAAAAALLLLGVVLLGTGAVVADVPDPGLFWWQRPRPRPRPNPWPRRPMTPEVVAALGFAAPIDLPATVKLPAEVQLETVEEGDSIVLTVPAPPKPADNEPKPDE